MKRKRETWIKHYGSSQKILLVGEGDFSFSACLAKAFGSAINMVATSLDSRDVLLTKYGSFGRHLEDLEKKGCLVLHEIDVKEMHNHRILKNMKFNVIVYNFPHAGHFGKESDSFLIEMHKDLLRGFFGSARVMLEEGGEVHLALRDDMPYTRWKPEEIARENGFLFKEKAVFEKEDYPGYKNKRGGSLRANKAFPLKDCFTYKFSVHRTGEVVSVNPRRSALSRLTWVHSTPLRLTRFESTRLQISAYY